MFDKTLHVIESVVVVVTFASITFLAFANVVSRYVLNASFSFTGELIVNCAALLTLVGASAAVRQGSHPGFSLLRDSTAGVLNKLAVSFVCVMMLTFYGLFLWLGMDMVLSQFESGRVTPALAVPQWIFSLALPIGALLGGMRTVQLGVNTLKNRKAFVGEDEFAIERAIEEAKLFEEEQDARKP